MTATPPVLAVRTTAERCTARDCDAAPTAVLAARNPDGSALIWWLCDEHAEAMRATALDAGARADDVPLYPLARTCRYDPPCGAVATHVAVLGNPDAQRLGALSCCGAHAASMLSMWLNAVRHVSV